MTKALGRLGLVLAIPWTRPRNVCQDKREELFIPAKKWKPLLASKNFGKAWANAG